MIKWNKLDKIYFAAAFRPVAGILKCCDKKSQSVKCPNVVFKCSSWPFTLNQSFIKINQEICELIIHISRWQIIFQYRNVDGNLYFDHDGSHQHLLTMVLWEIQTKSSCCKLIVHIYSQTIYQIITYICINQIRELINYLNGYYFVLMLLTIW